MELGDPAERFERMRTDPPRIDDQRLAEAMEQAWTAFRQVSRKGFDHEVETEPERIEAFRTGAGALLAARGLVDDYLAALKRIDRGKTDLDAWFVADGAVFSSQFQHLYGGPADATAL